MNFQKKILLIDGDQNFGNKIKKSLTLHKYNVCYERDSASGIKSAIEYNPDLILCELNMGLIDGIEVYNVLKDCFLLRRVPFIFLKQNASVEDVRHGMNLGADDFFSKPINIYDLVTSIEIQLQKVKNNSNELIHEFNTLFELSPNGIIVFNEQVVIKANQSLKKLLKIGQRDSFISIKDLFEDSSLLRIQKWIQQPINGFTNAYNETITIKDRMGDAIELNMVISEFTNYSNSLQFIGFFTPVSTVNNNWVNDEIANEVCNMLKREKITITDNLEEKITNIVKYRTLSSNNQNNSFFTKRENQVLSLTMEGLPIKIIADRLSISSRTVEKYRTKLMEKSKAKNIVEVIVFSLKMGLIKL